MIKETKVNSKQEKEKLSNVTKPKAKVTNAATRLKKKYEKQVLYV